MQFDCSIDSHCSIHSQCFSKSQISPIVSNSQNQAGVNPVESDNSRPDSLMDLNTVQPESESETGGSISEFNSQTALSSKSVLLLLLLSD
jgi:aconitase B